MTNPVFTRPITLCNKIIILDGLTGTGKTMFAPLISSFNRVQNGRFEYMFEYLAIAAKSGKLSEDASQTMLNLLADIKNYDGVISREVNFRPKDLSSVFKSSKKWQYLRQLFMADGASAGKRIESEKPILFLVTHQILSCIEPVLHAFPDKLSIVQMIRHPLYLLDHWDSYIDMHGKSPRDFTIWLDYKGESVPWFAAGWEEKYISSSQFDKVIYSIESLMKPVFAFADRQELRNIITFVPFEQFVLAPDKYIRQLEELLQTDATAATGKVLQQQKVPRKSINAGPQKSIYKRYRQRLHQKEVTHEQDYQLLLDSAKQKSSPEAFRVLNELSERYEKYFGLWF